MWYLSSWRDLRRRSNAGHGLWNKPEITPPSHSNHRPDGTAPRMLMVTDRTFYSYLSERKDDLREELRAIDEAIGDVVESKLMERIDAGDTTAIIFYCRSKLKHRGYVYGEQPEGQQQQTAIPTGRALV